MLAGVRMCVEEGDFAAQSFHHLGIDLTACEAALECCRLGQALHFDRPFDDLPVALYSNSCSVPSHRHSSQVDRRGKAAVEAYLLGTEVTALLQRAKVQEPQIHRLFDLVGVAARQ